MLYGITGNTTKERLWEPVTDLIRWLDESGLQFRLSRDVADGLIERGLVDASFCRAHCEEDLVDSVEVILSFGGDGTLLNSAHEVGRRGTPILGVNIGRLGFLADIEIGQVREAILLMEDGRHHVESRTVLEARLDDGTPLAKPWALNEFVIERRGTGKLMAVTVHVDGVYLNEYWANGLIMATPTGSTAYSLSTGGPIMMPGCGSLILTPVAPHTLTVRPIVIPDASVIQARVTNQGLPYVLAADGVSTIVERENLTISVKKAAHVLNLVKLPGRHYFNTIRSKLMWGALGTAPHNGEEKGVQPRQS